MLQKQKRQKESGVALIEMAISLSVCVLLILSILDIGMVLRRYVAITRIAYEGVRMASDQSRLTQDRFDKTTAVNDTSHQELHKKITNVINGYRLDTSQMSIVTERTTELTDNTVIVTLSSAPPPLFNGFLNGIIVISSTVNGPYLSTESDV